MRVQRKKERFCLESGDNFIESCEPSERRGMKGGHQSDIESTLALSSAQSVWPETIV